MELEDMVSSAERVQRLCESPRDDHGFVLGELESPLVLTQGVLEIASAQQRVGTRDSTVDHGLRCGAGAIQCLGPSQVVGGSLVIAQLLTYPGQAVEQDDPHVHSGKELIEPRFAC